MKKFLFVAAAVIASIGAMAQKIDDVIKVSSDKFDFGKIKQGVPVTTYFTLTNNTDKPIVIESARAGCGCTTPEFNKEPIAPGSSTQLKVGYNAAAMGNFTKPVNIKLAGVAEEKVVTITGEVVDANAATATTTTTTTEQKVVTTTTKTQKTVELKPLQKAKIKSRTTTKASK